MCLTAFANLLGGRTAIATKQENDRQSRSQPAHKEWSLLPGFKSAGLPGPFFVEARRGLIHGLITLAMARRSAGGPERTKHILQETMKDLLFAWSHRPPG
jgi:hypothetical protein